MQPALTVVILLLLAAVALAACGPGDAIDAALDQASDDLDCSESNIHVLDTAQTQGDAGHESFRLLACGHEVVYACHLTGPTKHRTWTCDPSGYRFPT